MTHSVHGRLASHLPGAYTSFGTMELRFGEHIAASTAAGEPLRAAVFDENDVRASAGLTLVLGAIAFSLALLEQQYIPLQAVTTFFFVEFLVRTTVGIRYSPVGLVARAMTRGMAPVWVSAKPKLFAWRIGLGMAFSMMIITNSGVRGWIPGTLCVICMTLMWMEAALGRCLGCELHAFLVRRGLTEHDRDYEICSGGVCDLPVRPAVEEPA